VQRLFTQVDRILQINELRAITKEILLYAVFRPASAPWSGGVRSMERGELRPDTRPQGVPLQTEQPVPHARKSQGAATDHAHRMGRPGWPTPGQPLHGVTQLRDLVLRRRVRLLKALKCCLLR
jgi:hypothetical protein